MLIRVFSPPTLNFKYSATRISYYSAQYLLVSGFELMIHNFPISSLYGKFFDTQNYIWAVLWSVVSLKGV